MKQTKTKMHIKKGLYLSRRRFHGDIEQYGYAFTWKNAVFAAAAALLTALFLGLLYKLNAAGLILLGIFCLILTPSIAACGYRKAYELKKFSDANKYMEKLLYYFKASRKILTSLEDMQKIFPAGKMASLLRKAAGHIRQGKPSGGDVREEALRMIEEEYGCSRMRAIHGFLFRAETDGGECSSSIDLLLEDRRLWAGRNVELQKKKQATFKNTAAAIGLTVLMCAATLYLINMLPETGGTWNINALDISRNPVVQITSLLFILVQLTIFYKAYEKSSMNWLKESGGISREKAFKLFRELSAWEENAHLANGIAWSVIPAAAAFLLYLKFRSPLIVLAGLGGILFMLNERRIGHRIMLKNYTKEAEKAFPEWLLGIVLLLNTESVPVAIRRSLDTAPAALAPAVEEMLAEIEEDPSSEYPYLQFLGFLNLPDIQEAMATLYSLVNGSGGDAEDEFNGILDHVFRMTDRAEALKNEDRAAVFEIYVMIPALAGAVKLMMDMTMLLMSMFQIRP